MSMILARLELFFFLQKKKSKKRTPLNPLQNAFPFCSFLFCLEKWITLETPPSPEGWRCPMFLLVRNPGKHETR